MKKYLRIILKYKTMGLYRYHKLNQGVHIEGGGLSIDLVVRKIGGTKKRREASLEVRGLSHTDRIYLYHNHITPLFASGIEIGIADPLGQSRNGSNSVTIFYDVPKKYSITPIL